MLIVSRGSTAELFRGRDLNNAASTACADDEGNIGTRTLLCSVVNDEVVMKVLDAVKLADAEVHSWSRAQSNPAESGTVKVLKMMCARYESMIGKGTFCCF